MYSFRKLGYLQPLDLADLMANLLKDPIIYTSDGVLLVLLHWRQPGQAKWVPLLDTKYLERLAGGRKEESYWPVAVSQEQFCCIILKVSSCFLDRLTKNQLTGFG